MTRPRDPQGRRRWTVVSLSLALAFILWLSSLDGSWAMPATRSLQDTIPGCIAGQIAVGGAQVPPGTIPLLCQPYTVSVDLCSGGTVPGCTVPPCTISVNADAYGRFTVCGLNPGTYNIRVSGSNTLAKLKTGVVVPPSGGTIPGTIPVDFGTLIPADANGNNVVDILDYSILATAYGKASGESGWDRRADFNCSGTIDILDYSLLATYYARAGDTCP